MLRMKEGESIAAKLQEIVNKIMLYGEAFPDFKIVEKILISLPARF